MSKSLQQNYLSPRFEVTRIGQTISDLNKGIYNRKIRLQPELNIKRSYHRLVEPFFKKLLNLKINLKSHYVNQTVDYSRLESRERSTQFATSEKSLNRLPI